MRVSLLDHGYLEAVTFWGSEEEIISAARMSTGKGFLGWGPFHHETCAYLHALIAYMEGSSDVASPDQVPCDCTPKPGDEKLLRYLWENEHHTPFEMAGATFEVQAPIFVFREWMRHRVPFSYNEMSARYTPLPDLNYVPSMERLALGSGSSKQNQSLGGKGLDREAAKEFRETLVAINLVIEGIYQKALRTGVPKELARLVLPVGRYSKMRVSSNLRGWLNFLKLREAPNAQYEIRVYAEALHKMLAEKFPRTLGLFEEGR
jgi:thymidylate synthase (FAD)